MVNYTFKCSLKVIIAKKFLNLIFKNLKYTIDKFLGLYNNRFHSESLDKYQKQEN